MTAHNPEVEGSNPSPATTVISQEIGIIPNPQGGFGVVLSLVWDGWMGW
jgi:hypothetical protein